MVSAKLLDDAGGASTDAELWRFGTVGRAHIDALSSGTPFAPSRRSATFPCGILIKPFLDRSSSNAGNSMVRTQHFAGIYQLQAAGNSNCNSVQTDLRRRFARGLALYASRLWSHSIDDASSGICSTSSPPA